MKVPKDTTATFVLEITADPLPDIEWTHNGKKLTKDGVTYDVKEEVLEHGLKKFTIKMEIVKGNLMIWK